MKCPICNREIKLEKEKEVQRAYCDCIGFRRCVVEIVPSQGKEVKNDRSQ
jgi:hypothetical protein